MNLLEQTLNHHLSSLFSRFHLIPSLQTYPPSPRGMEMTGTGRGLICVLQRIHFGASWNQLVPAWGSPWSFLTETIPTSSFCCQHLDTCTQCTHWFWLYTVFYFVLFHFFFPEFFSYGNYYAINTEINVKMRIVYC